MIIITKREQNNHDLWSLEKHTNESKCYRRYDNTGVLAAHQPHLKIAPSSYVTELCMKIDSFPSGLSEESLFEIADNVTVDVQTKEYTPTNIKKV